MLLEIFQQILMDFTLNIEVDILNDVGLRWNIFIICILHLWITYLWVQVNLKGLQIFTMNKSLDEY